MTVISFVLFFLVPADPAQLACGKACTQTDVERVAHYLGTDRPVYIQYGRFLGRLMPVSFKGGPHLKSPNLGRSFVNREDVNTIVAQAAPVTASLVLGGAILWMLDRRADRDPLGAAADDRSSTEHRWTFVLIGISAHPVWIGLILAYFIGYKWHITPISGYANFFHPPSDQPGGPVQWAYHLILPWITFAILFAALYVRMIRANVMETMNEDYVRTARAKGAPERVVMRSHILRNAMLPVVTMLGMDIGLALGGAVFTETVFGLPGPRLHRRPGAQQLRQPDGDGDHRVRDDGDHHAQPDRRLALRRHRSAHPARLSRTRRISHGPSSKSTT